MICALSKLTCVRKGFLFARIGDGSFIQRCHCRTGQANRESGRWRPEGAVSYMTHHCCGQGIGIKEALTERTLSMHHAWKGLSHGEKLILLPSLRSEREREREQGSTRTAWAREDTCGGLSREHWCSIALEHPIDGDSVRSGSLEAWDFHSPEATGYCEILSSLHIVGLLHLNNKVLIGQVICGPVECEAIPADLRHG